MIFITGCARSGTSLTTHILMMHGVQIGQVNGLFENTKVREDVLKPYLKRIGADPMGQHPLPDTDNLSPVNGLKEDVQRRLGDLLEPWTYKDAKLTLVWPVWAQAFPEAKWVLVRRDAEKIAESCLRTPFMRAYDTKDGWMSWVSEHEKRFERMRDELDIVEVWPDRFIADPREFEPVMAHLGLPFDVSKVEHCIERPRWH